MGCRKRIIATLRSTAGETITEVLVGVLIVGLATVVLATMINVATQVSLTSTAALQGAYEQTAASTPPRLRFCGFPGAGGRHEFQLGRVALLGAAGAADHFQRQRCQRLFVPALRAAPNGQGGN